MRRMPAGLRPIGWDGPLFLRTRQNEPTEQARFGLLVGEVFAVRTRAVLTECHAVDDNSLTAKEDSEIDFTARFYLLSTRRAQRRELSKFFVSRVELRIARLVRIHRQHTSRPDCE